VKSPKTAAWLLKLTLEPDERDDVVANLEELYQARHYESGAVAAYLWYWFQALTFSVQIHAAGPHISNTQAPTMQAYIPFAQNPASAVDLLIRSTIEPASLAASVRRQVRAIDKDQPVYGVVPLGDLVSQALARHRFTMLLLTGFAAVALAMAAVGVYGLISYAVGQRTREIGLRVALGAGRSSIFGMVMRQGVALAGVGVVAGLVASLWLTRSLETLLFEIEPTDPSVFIILSSLLLAIALAASYFPARRATTVDPTVALRHD
jgi:putative ABC transport system permease protein